MTDIGTGDGRFEPTRWSLVLKAADAGDAAGARGALEELLPRYWRPVYFYIRRRGLDPETAKDLTQGFFAHLLAGSGLAGVDPARGRFRGYLVGALSHFLANQARDSKRLKRGGDQRTLSLDFDYGDAESTYRLDPAGGDTPARAFERRWALDVLARALEATRQELEAAGKGVYHEVLVRTVGPRPASYAEIAAELDLSVGDVTNYLRRARRRLREALIAILLPGVRDPALVDQEIRDLFTALEQD